MKPYHSIRNANVEDGFLLVEIDGEEHSFLLREISPALANASYEELSRFEVSPAGYGIHWPLIDEDISIDGLLGVSHAPLSTSKHA